MDKKTKICIWIILIGLANFVAYTIIYMFIGGEALSGWVDVLPSGHNIYHLRSNTDEFSREVSLLAFLYSGIHSISIWLTVAAVMLAMLTLAKDRIISSMHSTVVRGRTFITILATIITFGTIVVTLWLTLQLVGKFRHPQSISEPKRPPTASAPASPGSAGRSTTP